MNYRKIYLKIVKNALVQNRKKYQGIYFEAHHILPRSLFPLWAKRKSNIVLLTAREHFFCHQLLSKIYPGKKMFSALWILANDGRNNYCVKGSKEYEKLKIAYAKLNPGKGAFFKGHHHTDQSKKQSSENVRNYWKNKKRIAHNYKGGRTFNSHNSPDVIKAKRSSIRKAQGNIVTCVETGKVYYGTESLRDSLNDPPSISSLKRWLNKNLEIEGFHYKVQHRPRTKN